MTPVTPVQKQSALDAVLASQAFARAQQLTDFLRYVCQEEAAGRGDALTEYQIGIEALGRRKDFSPLEDTIVRNRAYALRQRLDEYYRGEGQTDPVRIDLPRGSVRQPGPPPDATTAPAAAGHGLFSGDGRGGDEYSVYGLITVLPSEGTEGAEARTVILSGLGSAGTQAAAEFFTSDRSLAILDSHLKAAGTAPAPRAYQVIVKSTSQSGLPLTVRYHSHHILDR